MAVPTAQSVTLNVLAGLGSVGLNPSVLVNHSPTLLTASFKAKTVKSLTANTADQSVNLATLFPGISSVILIIIREVGGITGVSWSVNATGTRQPLPAEGLVLFQTSGAPPTLYFDNGHATEASYVEIGVLGS